MTPDQQTVARLLIERPVEYAHMLGYTLLTDLHNGWIRDMVMGREDITLQAHRGSYKTTAGAVAVTILMLTRGDLSLFFLRKTDDDVKKVIANVKRNLQHPVTQAISRTLTGKPLKLLTATATEITTSAYTSVNAGAQLTGMGTQSSITGKHADWIWTDDIVNLLDRRSRAERERIKEFYAELQNIRNRGGRIVNSGTPWHKEDAYTVMPPPRRWDCRHTGLMTEAQVETLRRSMPPSLFAANYELIHIAAEDALFKTPPTFATDALAREILDREDATAADLLRDGVAHVDAAYGGEDNTAFTCGRRYKDRIVLYGRMWHSHVDTVMGAILTEAQRLMCAPIYCEGNGDKGYLRKQLIAAGARAGSYHERENKYYKIATYLHKWWDHIVFLPDTDPAYISQIMDYNEDAEHDDAPDSAASIVRYLDHKRN